MIGNIDCMWLDWGAWRHLLWRQYTLCIFIYLYWSHYIYMPRSVRVDLTQHSLTRSRAYSDSQHWTEAMLRYAWHESTMLQLINVLFCRIMYFIFCFIFLKSEIHSPRRSFWGIDMDASFRNIPEFPEVWDFWDFFFANFWKKSA